MLLYNFWLLASVYCTLVTSAEITITPRDLMPVNRIVGGVSVDIRQYPHQLSLEKDGSHYCGASIINEYYAVTAAHCVYQTSRNSIRLRSGSSITSGGILHDSRAITVHQNYNPRTNDFDVALIQTVTKFLFNAYTQPILITDIVPSINDSLVVTGWGTTSEGGDLSRTLKAVSVPFVSFQKCSRDYFNDAITPRMFCAGTAGKDSCQGDSGGPIIRGGVLFGAVSWGQGCAREGFPGVYTNLADPSIRSWIKSITGA